MIIECKFVFRVPIYNFPVVLVGKVWLNLRMRKSEVDNFPCILLSIKYFSHSIRRFNIVWFIFSGCDEDHGRSDDHSNRCRIGGSRRPHELWRPVVGLVVTVEQVESFCRNRQGMEQFCKAHFTGAIYATNSFKSFL